MIFVDTNYFLAWLLEERDQQHRQAKELFQEAAAGKKELISSMIVFFEIYWVLTSFYAKKKAEIVSVLDNLLKLSFIKWENRNLLVESMAIFTATNLDLEDSYNLAFIRKNKIRSVKTFDKQLLKKI
ncbi:hypothetical protein A3E73_01075 [Candidatus Beckwithbacteria bacterium RIFCSPHIGHO2_12_FULL_47_17]|uniref:PIN domain-containing protein n=1 Tax=Candidatus Beckwithbacteria bacterium RIFCSPHIGHO2_12_FULL_47_17 TaxID=1797460 RepID=A0A1F5DJQ1_9BACT|nr:MAG: hypothetical protein A3E73_01075 [Candidatus Beckwithbacteria bacterium RIFCSPHIGHO2_12_FULL_47_17]